MELATLETNADANEHACAAAGALPGEGSEAWALPALLRLGLPGLCPGPRRQGSGLGGRLCPSSFSAVAQTRSIVPSSSQTLFHRGYWVPSEPEKLQGGRVSARHYQKLGAFVRDMTVLASIVSVSEAQALRDLNVSETMLYQ